MAEAGGGADWRRTNGIRVGASAALLRLAVAVAAAGAALLAAVFAAGPAVARPAESSASAAAVQATGTQRGPDPTIAMIEATRGPFATALELWTCNGGSDQKWTLR